MWNLEKVIGQTFQTFGQAFLRKGCGQAFHQKNLRCCQEFLIKHNRCAATVAPVDHADRVLEIRLSNSNVTPFSIKPFLTTVAPVDHAVARGFSIKPFFKRFAVDHAVARGFVQIYLKSLWLW